MRYGCDICDGGFLDYEDNYSHCFTCSCWICSHCKDKLGILFPDYRAMLNLKNSTDKEEFCKPGNLYIQCPKCDSGHLEKGE
jgi:hypothetical protein